MAQWTSIGYPLVLEKIAEKQIDLSSDTITAHLTDTAPSTSHAGLADISEIATGGGYTQGTGLAVTVTSSTMSGTTYQLTLSGTIGFVATGTVAQFRYIVLCFTAVSGDPVFVSLDCGEEVNLTAGVPLQADVDGTVIFSMSFV